MILSIKIQNTSILQAKRHIFNRTPNFASVPPLSTEQLFFSAGVVLSKTFPTPGEKHITSQNTFFITEQLPVAAYDNQIKTSGQ